MKWPEHKTYYHSKLAYPQNCVEAHNKAIDAYRVALNEACSREELVNIINKAFEDCEAPNQQVYSQDIADAIRKTLGLEDKKEVKP